jgi:mevalonate pyrophosphate decarboxylase
VLLSLAAVAGIGAEDSAGFDWVEVQAARNASGSAHRAVFMGFSWVVRGNGSEATDATTPPNFPQSPTRVAPPKAAL